MAELPMTVCISERKQPTQLLKPKSLGCVFLWMSFSSRVVKFGSLLHKSHFQEHLQWPFLHPPMYQVPWDDTVLVYRVQKSTLGPRLGHWKRACTSLAYNQPHWLFHHSMECSQPEWYKIDIENFTDEDLIEPTSSLCFFLKVCELYKLRTGRKILPLLWPWTFTRPTALFWCYLCPHFFPLACHTVCQHTLRNVQFFFDFLG